MASKVLIPFAPGFEEMEGIILADILRRGGVGVVVAALDGLQVVASRKTIHVADTLLSEVIDQEYDLILLPGGLEGTKNLTASSHLKQILLEQHKKQKWIGAICAAPNVLRTFGIIGEQDPYTAFPTSIDLSSGGKYSTDRIVSHKNVFTSVGPGSAFEFALFLLEKLEGTEVRERVEKALFLPK